MPPNQTTRMGDALRAAGKDATVTIVSGADHGFDHTHPDGSLTALGQQAAQSVVNWLASHF